MQPTEHNVKRTPLRTLLGRLFALGVLALSGGVQAQLLPPGTPDPAFGVGGQFTTDFGSQNDVVFALAPLLDGRFLAAGVIVGVNASGPGTSNNVAVARYFANGALDSNFGTGGLVQLDISGGPDNARAIKVFPDGGILVAGTLSSSFADFGLVKLLPYGSLDHNFGEGSGSARTGYVRLDIGGASVHDYAYAMAMQSNGSIIVAGVTPVLHGNGFKYTQVAVARFTANGDVDTSFGGNGTGFTILAPFYGDFADALTGIAVDPAGNMSANNSITLAGYGSNSGFIARLTADGAPDTSFGDIVGGGLRSGRVLLPPGTSGGSYTGLSYLSAARLTGDGHVVVAGQGGDRGITLIRYLDNGSLDTGFATAGRVTIRYSTGTDVDKPDALAIQGNGKLVASGYATSRATGAPRNDFYVARVLANGTVDAGFGDGLGRVVVALSTLADGSYALGIEPSGNLLVGGYAQDAAAGATQQWDFALLRLIGDPDRIFANSFE